MTYDFNKILQTSKKLRILLVEDDLEVRENLKQLLQLFFRKVDVASNGEEGLEAFKNQLQLENRYDLVVTDINMPKMDGFDMSQEILKLVPEQDIVVITGQNSKEYQQKSAELGLSDFITKPLHHVELCEYLQNMYVEKIKTKA